MSGIKGTVLLTRFDFIEHKFGKDELKAFFEDIVYEDKGLLQQPIGISKEYPEILLKAIDDAMSERFFKNDRNAYLKLGHWNATQLMPKYFQIYIEEHNPAGFLSQMVRMRDILIGLGEMHLIDINDKEFLMKINYGQTYLPSVVESELGFLEEGCHMCGAKNIEISKESVDDISIELRLSWNN
jgi:hypothetical protein